MQAVNQVGTTTTPKPPGMPGTPSFAGSLPPGMAAAATGASQTTAPAPAAPNLDSAHAKFPDQSKAPIHIAGAPGSGGSSKPSGIKVSLKLILGGVLLFLLVIGSGVGLYLSQQSQELRQEAAVMDNSCASSDCRGTCDNSPACGYAGDCSFCSESDATPEKGKRTFFCRGWSQSGCGAAHQSLIEENNSGVLGPITEDKWCTTVQVDAWGPAGSDARVAYIGDNGVLCVEGDGSNCNPANLDWDCTRTSPSPSPTPSPSVTPSPSPSPVSKTWDVTTSLICPDGTTPSAIEKRLFWTVWPPQPLVFNYNPALSAAGTVGSISQSITVDGITPGIVKSVYVGLTKASYGANTGGNGFKALTVQPANPNVVPGTSWNPPTQMFKWNVADVPSGSMTLEFEAPAELCAPTTSPSPSPSITPSPSPSPSPSQSPSPSPSPSPTPTPVPSPGTAACLWKRAYTNYWGSTDASRITSSSVVNPGDSFFYRIRVVTNNDGVVGSITVIDTLPQEVTFVADPNNTPGLSYDASTHSVSITFQTLTSVEIVEFKVAVKDTVSNQTIVRNSATVSSTASDTTAASECDLTLTITEEPAEPVYACNASCTTDEQCASVNAEYICSVAHGNTCRLDSNRDSTSCSPKQQTYACNSACETDDQCETANGNYFCHGEEKVCRLIGNADSASCTNPTAPSPSPTIGCNSTCAVNADCTNDDHICYTTPDGTNRCRLADYVNSSSCSKPSQTITSQPELPVALPQSGPAEWLTWMKAGIVTIGLGAILLLLL